MSSKRSAPTLHSPQRAEVSALRDALEAPNSPLLVDVRTPREFAGGHVPGAVNVPMSALGGAADLDRARPIWLICRSGTRSARAASTLAAQGFDVTDVLGGTLAWRRAGLPLEPPSAPPRLSGLLLPLVVSLTLGLAPFSPEPHLVGKLRWVAGGAAGMASMDWFDLLLHGSPWLWLGSALLRFALALRRGETK